MSSHARHFQPPPIASSPLPFQAHLQTSLTNLLTQYPPSSRTLLPSGGLYAGLLGIKTLDQHRREYWTRAKRYDRELLGDHGVAGVRVKPWRCGVGDDVIVYAALHVVFAIEDEGSIKANEEVDAFCKAITSQITGCRAEEQSKRQGKPASNEWLYGRAGTLFLLRLVRQAYIRCRASDSDDDSTTLSTIDDSIRAVVREVVNAPRPWVWHRKAYLGAVHGSAGITAQVLLSMKAIRGAISDEDEEAENWIASMETDVVQLLDSQFKEGGNWPSSLPSSPGEKPADKLLQFCHGSPGIIACLSHILSFYPHLSSKITNAVTRAQPDLFARGRLAKEPCLCHGATGNALALHDQKAREAFLAHATEDVISDMIRRGLILESESPEGLYTGLAGRVWVWALGATKAFNEDQVGNFPGFDDV